MGVKNFNFKYNIKHAFTSLASLFGKTQFTTNMVWKSVMDKVFTLDTHCLHLIKVINLILKTNNKIIEM